MTIYINCNWYVISAWSRSDFYGLGGTLGHTFMPNINVLTSKLWPRGRPQHCSSIAPSLAPIDMFFLHDRAQTSMACAGPLGAHLQEIWAQSLHRGRRNRLITISDCYITFYIYYSIDKKSLKSPEHGFIGLDVCGGGLATLWNLTRMPLALQMASRGRPSSPWPLP